MLSGVPDVVRDDRTVDGVQNAALRSLDNVTHHMASGAAESQDDLIRQDAK